MVVVTGLFDAIVVPDPATAALRASEEHLRTAIDIVAAAGEPVRPTLPAESVTAILQSQVLRDARLPHRA